MHYQRGPQLGMKIHASIIRQGFQCKKNYMIFKCSGRANVTLDAIVDISDHRGTPKPFSSDCLVTVNKKQNKMANYAELFSRNKAPSLHRLNLHEVWS